MDFLAFVGNSGILLYVNIGKLACADKMHLCARDRARQMKCRHVYFFFYFYPLIQRYVIDNGPYICLRQDFDSLLFLLDLYMCHPIFTAWIVKLIGIWALLLKSSQHVRIRNHWQHLCDNYPPRCLDQHL